ncbi:2-dehydro-3-deoxygalactonokinase [Microvirga tunisiensis]|uniref:2-dehydro-3-deoxygalactonokinase n=2 Tax=Microvirga tunisiensis TaxID=2108360 RepID=A0A5N7MKS2_9HYPH|nr:2-dehydro-3-deoxygalactonokinase [Microvirga tunisiensis]MPR27577.1 2-dehydro-3-deoxygalactonokinase [Microvirga tunisiensis]
MKNGRMDRFAPYMIGEMYGRLREHSMVEPAPNKGAVGARIQTTTYSQASANSPCLRPQIGPVAKWPYLRPEVCSSRPPRKLFCGKGRGRIGTIPGLFLPDPTDTIGAAPCHPEGASRC